jgi:Protein of unknown function (DUF3987)/RepB DNA-primase N-terminal domain
MKVASLQEQSIRVEFFRYLFREDKGYVCLATESAVGGDFLQHFFQWPLEEQKLHNFIEKHRAGKNIWYCVNLLTQANRKKQYCQETHLLWSDLDEVDIDEVVPEPQLVVESSPGRYQAIWILDTKIDPYVAEDFSRRLAYHNDGDKSGWDLTQLLRVPFTNNFKYDDHPVVQLQRATSVAAPIEVFDKLAEVSITEAERDVDATIPTELPDVDGIIYKYREELKKGRFFSQFGYEPDEDDDWSTLLWGLLLTCFEAKMSAEEVYAIALGSNVNKYERDNRPTRYLWRDVLKAQGTHTTYEALANVKPFEMPELIPGEKYDLSESFIDRYRIWGEEATDACPQYHDLSAFMLLSSLLAGSIKLETNYSTVRMNLWGLVLGDSTLTRKSTAMRMATDFIAMLDDDILLATDGSVEGLLSALQGRDNRTSLFFRDEVTGLFDSMRRKDYLAGMPQMFTQLYDAQGFFKRQLKKETIVLTDPIFVFFGGGIREHVYTSADESYIVSGFLPRFLIVSGSTDLSRIRRTGPPSPTALALRQEISEKLYSLHETYTIMKDVEILGQRAEIPTEVQATLTPEAWELYGDIEMRLAESASNSANPPLALPTFERLSRSMLKMAVLVGASGKDPNDGGIEIDTDDVRHAAKYVQEWGHYSIEILENIGRTVAIRAIEKALNMIQERPGIQRGQIMRFMNLTKREMNEIQDTLEARGEISVSTAGRGVRYTAI